MYWWASSRAGACYAICRSVRAVALQSTIPYPANLAGELAGARLFLGYQPACCKATGSHWLLARYGTAHRDPTLTASTAWHVRAGDAGMKRHRPLAKATTVYLERRATGSLADLHLHLHAGPLPVARWPAHLYGRR